MVIVVKFSVQARFDRIAVKRKEISWILCDFCGSTVNRLIYDSHVGVHDLGEMGWGKEGERKYYSFFFV